MVGLVLYEVKHAAIPGRMSPRPSQKSFLECHSFFYVNNLIKSKE